MRWNRHSELKDKHSFLSASKYQWIRYTPETLVERYAKSMDAARGTRLHALAHMLISEGIKLPNTGQTLNMYVNDCIGYRMATEQVLAYIPPGRVTSNAFGTADAINFTRDPETDIPVLRIFDLKNGVTKASGDQLLVYAAYFCLEYLLPVKVRPMDIEFDLRIYQNDAIHYVEMDPEDVVYVMDRIVEYDKLIEKMKEEEGVLL